MDPALFALPHQQGFSGLAWLSLVPVQHQITTWTPPPRLLSPVTALLGEPLRVFARTNQTPVLEIALLPSPHPSDLKVASEPGLTKSELRVTGELADRPIVTPVVLPSIANADLLEKTVVQILVDAKGWVRSQVLLATSGMRQADHIALEIARALRFQSLAQPTRVETESPPALTRGELVFQWHTVPVTNAPPGGS
jgi:hypothetical protein